MRAWRAAARRRRQPGVSQHSARRRAADAADSMEEGKADELYRLFKRTDEGARFKQGLGFGAGAGAAAEQPWQRGSAGAATGSKPTSLSSMFVKAGQAPTAPPQQPTQQHPAAAADAAARVAARMAQLKQQQHREQRQQDEDDDDDDNRRRRRSPGAAPRRSRSRSRSRDRRDRSSHHHHHRSRSRSRDRSRDRRRSRSRSRDRDSRRWRDRSRSQDEPRRRDRPDRDRNRARGSSRERQRRETPSGSAAAAAEAREDYRRLIPSYDRLTPAEQLRARTALALERADASSRKREAAEAREGSGAVVRPWTRCVRCLARALGGVMPAFRPASDDVWVGAAPPTRGDNMSACGERVCARVRGALGCGGCRYIFNTLADLDEAAGAGGGGSTAGAGVGDVREVARELGIDAEEERLRAPQQSLQVRACPWEEGRGGEAAPGAAAEPAGARAHGERGGEACRARGLQGHSRAQGRERLCVGCKTCGTPWRAGCVADALASAHSWQCTRLPLSWDVDVGEARGGAARWASTRSSSCTA